MRTLPLVVLGVSAALLHPTAIMPQTFNRPPISATPSWTQGETLGPRFLGDVNGDTFPDILLQVYDGSSWRHRVYLGSASGFSQYVTWSPKGTGGVLPRTEAATAAGDVNGDGFSDIIVPVTSPTVSSSIIAWVYHGSASGPSEIPAWQASSNQTDFFYGYTVSAAGDVNNDGYGDVMVGEYGSGACCDAGGLVPITERARLWLGSTSGLSTLPATTIQLAQQDINFGHIARGIGDVNGDGYDDVLIGGVCVPCGNTLSRLYVHHGTASGLTPAIAVLNQAALTAFGANQESVTAGDVNNDGYSDAIIGAPWYGNGQYREGAFFVHLGSPSGIATAPALTIQSNMPEDYMGLTVVAGDTNGDGFDDVVISAGTVWSPPAHEGLARAYLGSSSGLEQAPSWNGSGLPDSDYSMQLILTDVNSDAHADLVVGAPAYRDCGPALGRVFLYQGQVDGPAASLPSGSVPDGSAVPGVPLKVDLAPGGDLTLSWSGSCLPNDTDFEVYEGSMCNFMSHGPRFCSTSGMHSVTFAPAPGSSYYLVVPRNSLREGSYGLRSNGSERPQGFSACLPQEVVDVCQ